MKNVFFISGAYAKSGEPGIQFLSYNPDISKFSQYHDIVSDDYPYCAEFLSWYYDNHGVMPSVGSGLLQKDSKFRAWVSYGPFFRDPHGIYIRFSTDIATQPFPLMSSEWTNESVYRTNVAFMNWFWSHSNAEERTFENFAKKIKAAKSSEKYFLSYIHDYNIPSQPCFPLYEEKVKQAPLTAEKQHANMSNMEKLPVRCIVCGHNSGTELAHLFVDGNVFGDKLDDPCKCCDNQHCKNCGQSKVDQKCQCCKSCNDYPCVCHLKAKLKPLSSPSSSTHHEASKDSYWQKQHEIQQKANAEISKKGSPYFKYSAKAPWEERGVTVKPRRYNDTDWNRTWPAVDINIDMCTAAADFYLLEAMANNLVNVVRMVDGQNIRIPYSYGTIGFESYTTFEARRLFDAFVDHLSLVLEQYCHLAIGGELRHHPAIGGRVLDGNRTVAWSDWKRIVVRVGPQAIADAAELFREPYFGSSYGGPKWAAACDVLHMYSTGKLSKAQFIDRVFTLQHNGGILLNKVHWASTNDMDYQLSAVQTIILPAHGKMPEPDWDTLFAVASPHIQHLFVDHWNASNEWISHEVHAQRGATYSPSVKKFAIPESRLICNYCNSDPSRGHVLFCTGILCNIAPNRLVRKVHPRMFRRYTWNIWEREDYEVGPDGKLNAETKFRYSVGKRDYYSGFKAISRKAVTVVELLNIPVSAFLSEENNVNDSVCLEIRKDRMNMFTTYVYHSQSDKTIGDIICEHYISLKPLYTPHRQTPEKKKTNKIKQTNKKVLVGS